MTLLWVALGAAVGAPTRFLTDRALRARFGPAYPWGTLAVNVAGSLVLGVLAGAASVRPVPGGLVAGLGTGFCGALTTYSTFGYETLRLAEEGPHRPWPAVANIVISLTLGIGAAVLGWTLGRLT